MQEKPRRSAAPLPLLVLSFLARTRPLLCPRRSMRRSTSEPAAAMRTRAAGSTTSGTWSTASGTDQLTPAGQRASIRLSIGARRGRTAPAPFVVPIEVTCEMITALVDRGDVDEANSSNLDYVGKAIAAAARRGLDLT